MTKNINRGVNDKIVEFGQLLDSITSMKDRRKLLWLDIYTNALQDRDYALNMFTHLSEFVATDPQAHGLHGPNIAKYIERMSRANDQLLKLAELVSNALSAQDDSEAFNTDALYDKFNEETPKVGKRR